MEKHQEGQVWQRVLTPPPAPPRDGLRVLRRESLALAGCYHHLSASLSGKAAEKAGLLYREELTTATTLRGLEVLCSMDGGKLKPPQPPREPPLRLLQNCYHRTRTALTEYTVRTVDCETGAVFRQLANRAERQLALLAELMGILY